MLRKYRITSLVVVLFLALVASILSYHGSLSKGKKNSGINIKKESEKVETITYVQGKDLSSINNILISLFEKKYPNIKVNYEELPNSTDDQHNILAAKFSAGDTNYDVVAMDIVWTAEFAEEGWLAPLDESFPKYERDKHFNWSVKSVTYNGHIYGAPKLADAGVLYYRKDILPKAPETWGELIEMCNKYTGRGGTKYGILFQGNRYEGLVCNTVEFIGSNGGSIMEDGKITINTPNAIGGLKFMRKLVNEKYASPEVTSYQEDDALFAFQQGKALFMRNWPYAWVQLNTGKNSKVKGEVAIAKIPRGEKGKNGVACLGGWNLGINNNSNHKEAALKFLKFITGEEGQKTAAIKAGLLPTIKALYKDKDILKSNPYWYNFYDILVAAIPRPVTPFYSTITDKLQSSVHKAITGEITPEKAVRDIENGIRKITERK